MPEDKLKKLYEQLDAKQDLVLPGYNEFRDSWENDPARVRKFYESAATKFPDVFGQYKSFDEFYGSVDLKKKAEPDGSGTGQKNTGQSSGTQKSSSPLPQTSEESDNQDPNIPKAGGSPFGVLSWKQPAKPSKDGMPGTDFERRLYDPKAPFIKNPDGTRSTHKMAYAGVDGKFIAYPTIVMKDGKLTQLSDDEAVEFALKNKEYAEFFSEKAAKEYAEGGYKKGTVLDPNSKESIKEKAENLKTKFKNLDQNQKALQNFETKAKELDLTIEEYSKKAAKNNNKLPEAEYLKYKSIVDERNALTEDYKKTYQEYKKSVDDYNLDFKTIQDATFNERFEKLQAIKDPIQRIKMYRESQDLLQKRVEKSLINHQNLLKSGNQLEAQKLQQIIAADVAKIKNYDKAIEGQKMLAAMKEKSSATIGLMSLGGYLASGVNFLEDLNSQIIYDITGFKLSDEALKEIKQINEKTGTVRPSDAIAKLGKEMLSQSERETELKRLNMPYQGGVWDALSNGDIKSAISNAGSGFVQSLPISLLMTNPLTGTLTSMGMAQQSVDEARKEKGSVTTEDYLAGIIKTGSEYAFENMFGTGKALKEMVKKLGSEASQTAIEQTLKVGIKDWAKKVGLTITEESLSEGVTQIAQNLVDISMGKEIGVFDNVPDATLIGMFGGVTQGTATVTISHLIDRAKAKKFKSQKEEALNLQEEALNAPSPVIAEALEKQAAKVNAEADGIAEELNDIAANSDPEIVEKLDKVNKDIDELEEALPNAPSEGMKEAIQSEIQEKQEEADDLLALLEQDEEQEEGAKEGAAADTEAGQGVGKGNKEEVEAKEKVVPPTQENPKGENVVAQVQEGVEAVKSPVFDDKNLTNEESKINNLGGKLIDAVVDNDAKLRADGKGSKEVGLVLRETLTIKEESDLYNTNDEYRKLFDKSEDGTITEKEQERLSEIYVSEKTKKQVSLLGRLYQKAKKEGNNEPFVKAVDELLAKSEDTKKLIEAKEEVAPQEVSVEEKAETKEEERQYLLSELEKAIERTKKSEDKEAENSLTEKYNAIKNGGDFSVKDVTKDAIRGIGSQFGVLQAREAKKDNYQRQLESYEKKPTLQSKAKIIELEKLLGYETSYFDLIEAQAEEAVSETKEDNVPLINEVNKSEVVEPQNQKRSEKSLESEFKIKPESPRQILGKKDAPLSDLLENSYDVYSSAYEKVKEIEDSMKAIKDKKSPKYAELKSEKNRIESMIQNSQLDFGTELAEVINEKAQELGVELDEGQVSEIVEQMTDGRYTENVYSSMTANKYLESLINQYKDEASTDTGTEERSTEVIIAESEAIRNQAEVVESVEEIESALQKLENQINSIDAKIVKLTESWDESSMPMDEQPGRQMGKKAKKEIAKFFGEVSKLMGFGKPNVSPNIAPAGGSIYGTIVVPNTMLKIEFQASYEPEYSSERGYNNYELESIMYRVVDKDKKGANKYISPNKWIRFKGTQFGSGWNESKSAVSKFTPKDMALEFAKELAPILEKEKVEVPEQKERAEEIQEMFDGKKTLVGKTPVEPKLSEEELNRVKNSLILGLKYDIDLNGGVMSWKLDSIDFEKQEAVFSRPDSTYTSGKKQAGISFKGILKQLDAKKELSKWTRSKIEFTEEAIRRAVERNKYVKDSFVNISASIVRKDFQNAEIGAEELAKEVYNELIGDMIQETNPKTREFGNDKSFVPAIAKGILKEAGYKPKPVVPGSKEEAQEKIKDIVKATGAPKDNIIIGSIPSAEQTEEQKIKAAIAEKMARLRKLTGGNLSSGVSLEALQLAVEITGDYVKLGIKKFDTMIKNILDDFGPEVLRDVYPAMKRAYGSHLMEQDTTEGYSEPAEVQKFDLEKFITENGNTSMGDPESGNASGMVEREPQGVSGRNDGTSVAGVPDTGSGQSNESGGDIEKPRNERRRSAGGGKPDNTLPNRNDLKPSQNFVIYPDADLVPKGNITKIKANIEAIKLAKDLDQEGRNATFEEKEVLAKYVGWGGLADALNEGKAAYRNYEANWDKTYGKYHDELKALLTPEEFTAAVNSTINAHYTALPIIDKIWGLVERLGFVGGNVLEPGAGVGHFIGKMPYGIAQNSKTTAYELDKISGLILEKLYPETSVRIDGFENALEKVNSQDLVISNVPFAANAPYDSKFKDLSKMNLHNYFIAKSLKLLKPGGIGVFITSSSTMDGGASSKKFREWAVSEGSSDFIGAIRLPNNAFAENAGTEVTTDIVVFRKRNDIDSEAIAQRFINLIPIGSRETVEPVFNKNGSPKIDRKTGLPAEIRKTLLLEVNEFFNDFPQMMLGEMKWADEAGSGGLYRAIVPTLSPKPDQNLLEDISDAIKYFPENIFGAELSPESNAIDSKGNRDSTFVEKDGNIYFVDGSEMFSPSWLKERVGVDSKSRSTKEDVVKDYLKIKSLVQSLVAAELQELDSAEALRAELNEVYDNFVSKYKTFTRNKKLDFLEEDAEHMQVYALEEEKSKFIDGRKRYFVEKSPIFSKRVNFPFAIPDKADGPLDALNISLSWKGKIDLEYMADISGLNPDDLKKFLLENGEAFINPETGMLEDTDSYLSGYVRTKLKQAKAAMENEPLYRKNVEALEKVVLSDLLPLEIEFRLGTQWIPASMVSDWLESEIGIKIPGGIQFNEATGNWVGDFGRAYGNALNNETVFGAFYSSSGLGYTAAELVGQALNLKRPIVSYVDSQTKATIKLEKETEENQTKQLDLMDKFYNYIRGDEAKLNEVAAIYNDFARDFIDKKRKLPVFETYPGAYPEIKLRLHQRKAVQRAVLESTLLGHQVGTGKTFTMITAAMEMRRLGLAKKPMIVVQNATLNQFGHDFKKLYPSANILVPSEKQMDAKNRQKLFNKIAYGDFDAVIIPQSFLDLMPDNPDRVRSYMAEEIEKLKDLESESKDDRSLLMDIQRQIRALEGQAEKFEIEQAKGGTKKVKDEAKANLGAEKRLKKQADRRVDATLTFEQMGVDALFIDEAHNYKKLGFNTKMSRIKGIDTGRSKRAFGLKLKIDWINEKTPGRNIVFATGTPITNTMAEAWTMIKFIAPETIKKYNMQEFDAFASSYGVVEPSLEFTTSGNFKIVERFKKFMNAPEFLQAFRTNTDVVLTEDVPEFNPYLKPEFTELAIKKLPKDTTIAGIPISEAERIAKIYHDAADSLNPAVSTAVEGLLGTPSIPKLRTQEDGKRGFTNINIPQTAGLKSFMSEVKRILIAWEKLSGKEKKAQSHVPIVMFTRAKQAAIDLRLVDPNAPDDPGSKTNAVVKEAKRIYEESKDFKGTQMIFSDQYQSPKNNVGLSTNLNEIASDNEETEEDNDSIIAGRFNLYREIKNKLVKLGIPENEIAIITDYKKDVQKQDLFNKVNNGDIRILLGSTQKMGVGVNAQERLVALHHVDAPPRPMDFEQRNGRILRQGNTLAALDIPVEVLTYGVIKTLDATAYQRLEIKQGFINQAMKGEGVERVMQDESDEDDISSMGFGQMMATLSGSQYATLFFMSQYKLKRLKNAREQHYRAQMDIAKRIKEFPKIIEALEPRAKEIEVNIKIVKEFFPNNKIESIEIDGEKYVNNSEEYKLSDVIDGLAQKLMSDKRQKPSSEVSRKVLINGMPTTIKAERFLGFDGKIEESLSWKIDRLENTIYGNFSKGSGLLTSVAAKVSKVNESESWNGETPKSIETRIENYKKDLEKLKTMEGKPFPSQEKLDKEIENFKFLEDAMQKEVIEDDVEPQTSEEIIAEDENIAADYDNYNETVHRNLLTQTLTQNFQGRVNVVVKPSSEWNGPTEAKEQGGNIEALRNALKRKNITLSKAGFTFTGDFMSKQALTNAIKDAGLEGFYRVELSGATKNTSYPMGGTYHIVKAETGAHVNPFPSKFMTKSGKVYGAYYDNTVYIDPNVAGPDTPLHEFGHAFLEVLKGVSPRIVDRGMELIEDQGQTYIQEVENDPAYDGLDRNEILEEALVRAVADKGVGMTKSVLQKFEDWLKEFWENIKNIAGIYTNEDFEDYDLEQYVTAMAKTMLSNDQVQYLISLGTNLDQFEDGYITPKPKFSIKDEFGLSTKTWNQAIRIMQAARDKGEPARGIAEALDFIRDNNRDWDKSKEFREFFYKRLKLDTEERARVMRKSANRVMSDPTLSLEIKNALSEEAIYYNQLPLNLTSAEAEKLVSIYGVDFIEESLKNPNIYEPTKIAMGVGLIKRLQADGQYERAANFMEALFKRGTEIGQAANAFKLLEAFDSVTWIRSAMKDASAIKDKKVRQYKRQMLDMADKLRDINSEAAEEVIKKLGGYGPKKRADIVNPEPSANKTKPQEYGSANKLVTRDLYEAAKKAIRGKFFSAFPPELITIATFHVEATGRAFGAYTKAMIEDLGENVKPHLGKLYSMGRDKAVSEGQPKDYYLSDEEFMMNTYEQTADGYYEKLKEALEKQNQAYADKNAKALQNIAKQAGLWQKYRDLAARRLAQMTASSIQGDISEKPIIEEFTNLLLTNMKGKVNQAMGVETKSSTPKPGIFTILDAYKNFEKYEDVWERTKAIIEAKYADNPEVLDMLDEYFGTLMETPFNKKLMQRSIREQLKTNWATSIDDIVRNHYNSIGVYRQNLADSFIEFGGLSKEDAIDLANRVKAEFDSLVTEKKMKVINQMLEKRPIGKTSPKGLDAELVKLSNLGAFSNAEFIEKIAGKYGWGKLTTETIQEIERLSKAVQDEQTNEKKFRAIEDLLKYQAQLKGTDWSEIAFSTWYASVLSGPNTQEVNIGQNFIQTLSLALNAAIQNPGSTPLLAKSLLKGFQTGLIEANETMRTGYSPIRGKVEVPTVLERTNFWGGEFNPLNYYKFVRRFMIASDEVFFEALKELRVSQLAWSMAQKEGLGLPGTGYKWKMNKAIEIMNLQSEDLIAATSTAKAEAAKAIKEINSMPITKVEKDALILQEKRDIPRRIASIIQESRPMDIVDQAARFAAEGTYNYKPTGFLGYIVSSINRAKTKAQEDVKNSEGIAKAKALGYLTALNLSVPFTNIVANVFNETVNYSPLGLTRVGQIKKREDINEGEISQRVADQYTKAILGTLFMTALYMLTGDEDDDNYIEITANGAGDYKKNYLLKETGWQPFSIKIGGKWYSYQYSPFFMAFALIGNLRDYDKYRGGKEMDTWSQGALAWSLQKIIPQMTNATFLQGLNGLVSWLTSEKGGDKLEAGADQLIRSTKAFVIPNLYEQSFNEVQKLWDMPEKNASTMKAKLLKDIPVARNQFYDKLNVLGEPILPETDKFISLVESHPEFELLVRKNAFLVTPVQSKSTILEVKEGGEITERIMTDEEFYNYVKFRGTTMKNYLANNYSRLSGAPKNAAKQQIEAFWEKAGIYAKELVNPGRQKMVKIDNLQDMLE